MEVFFIRLNCSSHLSPHRTTHTSPFFLFNQHTEYYHIHLVIDDIRIIPHVSLLFMMLVIMNRGSAPVHLEEGEVLGKLHLVQMAEKTPAGMETAEQEEESHSHVAAIQTGSGEERRKQLPEKLSLQDTGTLREEEQLLIDLVSKFADIFALCSSELGQTTVVEHHIDTGDHRPVRQPPRRVPFALRETVAKLVEEMLDQGVIVPSSSPWASPIVLVMKKDGSTRFCIDWGKEEDPHCDNVCVCVWVCNFTDDGIPTDSHVGHTEDSGSAHYIVWLLQEWLGQSRPILRMVPIFHKLNTCCSSCPSNHRWPLFTHQLRDQSWSKRMIFTYYACHLIPRISYSPLM